MKSKNEELLEKAVKKLETKKTKLTVPELELIALYEVLQMLYQLESHK